MAIARPLRDVFAELTGDAEARATGPAEVLRANGHADLPDGLVAEAVINYAETAPVEVAEHLAAFVTAHSAVPTSDGPGDGGPGADVDASAWLGTLATAPAALDGVDVAVADPTDSLDEDGFDNGFDNGLDELPATGPAHLAGTLPDGVAPDGVAQDAGWEFGLGLDEAGSADVPDAADHNIGEIRYEGPAAPHESVAGEADAALERYSTPQFGNPADDGGLGHDGALGHDAGLGNGGDDGQPDAGFAEGGAPA